ncbi:uncharacterized protein LOC121516572 [Cheilinus undulatus]|uniref:uncharacterized protein LOC121516572 n=1 Tax=Cheilinus undulatus TaxID=241271 RepID=UPI001BD356F7|nr:uncharacterized protein LOC121516572 [Cheilinus undulatus]XP_041653856.1 uncharacterized protein LOC121516572 [Cheilinus undulatus]
MTGVLVILSFLFTLSQTVTPHQISMIVVNPGDDLNLTCQALTGLKAGLFYWFKLKFGHMVQRVAAGSFENIKLEDTFKNSRFTVTFMSTLYFLSIRNVSKEDEATYFCQAGSAYEMKVLNGTLVAVNDHKNHQISVYVKQSPESQSVLAGHSVSLQCSLLSKHKETREQCPSEHDVYWFRAGAGEYHPAVIYTSETRRVKSVESCAYSLSKTIHNSSDAGTYYCAVATCGQVLFGEGTTVYTEICGQEWIRVVIVLGTLLVLCVIVIVVLIFSKG